jgi:archaellum component FlaC
MTDPDIVTRLRVLNHHAKKLAENESLHDLHRDAFTRCENLTCQASNEIERLRKQHDVMMEFVRNVANDFNALSTRPRDAIRFGELVNTIQMWGDNANEILEDTNGS